MNLKLSVLFFATLVNCNCFSQWNTNPSINTATCTALNDQQDLRIVTDTKSGAIISWVDFRNTISAGDIYVQRMNAAGYPVWTANGVAACTNTADQSAVALVDAGNGSAIMAWQDWRNGNKDIYAQKVDSSGTMQWTSNGVAVSVKAYHQGNPKMINDGAGGAILVWEDSINGSWDIYVQRISNTGAAMWTSGGVAICNAIDSQVNPKLRTDGAGGAIITWQDKRSGNDYDIYAQRINASGMVQWAANGVTVCTVTGTQSNPKLESDGQNGVIIAWQDKRNGIDYDIYAQRLNSSGLAQWTMNGVVICNAFGSQSAIDMTTDMVNGAIISWKDVRTGLYSVYANLISLSGTVQWATNGVLLAPGINPNVVGDANGGAIITWQDSTSAGGTWDVFSQRLNSSGTKLWTANGVPIANAAGGQSSAKNVSTGNGGSIYAWQDKRNGIDLDIYSHHLYANGSPLGIYEIEKNSYQISCYPNPFNSSCTLSVNSPKALQNWSLNVYDATGKLVFSQVIKNSNNAMLYKNNLSKGIYLFQAVTNSEIIGSGNFIISDQN